MSRDNQTDLKRLRESNVFKAYSDLRAMCMYYDMMVGKYSELMCLIGRIRGRGDAHWRRYGNIESDTMELSQTLFDFLSRMYFCKNYSSMCAKRYGFDDAFRALKKQTFAEDASILINLRNYMVHVDMSPLEIDTDPSRTSALRFTARCRSNDIWSAGQKRLLRDADPEDILRRYNCQVIGFYQRYFDLMNDAMDSSLRMCRREIADFNSRQGFEMIHYGPLRPVTEP